MNPESIPMKQTKFRVGYSKKEFLLSGSAADQSVIGAISGCWAHAGVAPGVWEPHVTELMARLINPTDICLDIGANVGVFTLVMSDLAPQGHVYAFEPSSANFRFLQKNIVDNHLSNANAYNLAMGNKTGTGNFHYLPEFAACSFAEDQTVNSDPDKIIRSAWAAHEAAGGAPVRRVTEAIELNTLDQWMAQNAIDRLNFIKLDVEGSERFVVEGGKNTFEEFRPILFTELNTMCLTKYFGLSPSSYFDVLNDLYPFIYVLTPVDNTMRRLNSYSDLVPFLTTSRWWADLLCMNRPI